MASCRRRRRAGHYGNLIVLTHAFGLSTRYGHLSADHVTPGATRKTRRRHRSTSARRADRPARTCTTRSSPTAGRSIRCSFSPGLPSPAKLHARAGLLNHPFILHAERRGWLTWRCYNQRRECGRASHRPIPISRSVHCSPGGLGGADGVYPADASGLFPRCPALVRGGGGSRTGPEPVIRSPTI